MKPPKLRPETETHPGGWTDWIRPKRRGYLMGCCDCGLIHELDFAVVKRVPFKEGEYVKFDVVKGADVVFRARRKPRLTAAYRKATGKP